MKFRRKGDRRNGVKQMTTLPQSSHYAMGEGEMVKGQWSKSKGKEERRKGDRRKGVISQPQPNLNFSYFLRVKDKWLKAKGEKVKGGMESRCLGRRKGDRR